MSLQIGLLGTQFLCRFVWNAGAGPDLAMRMWIARTHHSSAVFEYLHIPDPCQLHQFPPLFCPLINNSTYGGNIHGRQSEIVARREAHYAADTGFTLGLQ